MFLYKKAQFDISFCYFVWRVWKTESVYLLYFMCESESVFFLYFFRSISLFYLLFLLYISRLTYFISCFGFHSTAFVCVWWFRLLCYHRILDTCLVGCVSVRNGIVCPSSFPIVLRAHSFQAREKLAEGRGVGEIEVSAIWGDAQLGGLQQEGGFCQ